MPEAGYEYSGYTVIDCVAISLVATLLVVRADRTVFDVALAVLSAPLLVVPRTETVAFIRTASGTTVVVPVALMVMYRVSAAEAGTARPNALAREKMVIRAASL